MLGRGNSARLFGVVPVKGVVTPLDVSLMGAAYVKDAKAAVARRKMVRSEGIFQRNVVKREWGDARSTGQRR